MVESLTLAADTRRGLGHILGGLLLSLLGLGVLGGGLLRGRCGLKQMRIKVRTYSTPLNLIQNRFCDIRIDFTNYMVQRAQVKKGENLLVMTR